VGRELVVQRKGRFRFGLAQAETRSDPGIAFQDWVDLVTSMTYQGVQYSMPSQAQEEIAANFGGFARAGYKGNAVVFACMALRMQTFSAPRFQFRRLNGGVFGDYFGTDALAPLETPGPGQTTADLLTRMILHADLGGNWFGTNRYGGIVTLQPNWMTIVAGSEKADASLWDPQTKVAGYMYQPGGPGSGEDPIVFLPEEIAHFAPLPDPEARFRGMSWLTPVIREIMADKAFTDHKLAFTEHGATPNMLVKFPVDDVAKYDHWIEKFREQHEGAHNALKTLFLGAGMDATPIGTNLQELDLRSVQGAGETRVAAAAGAPPVLVGLSEGLAAATYSNYGMARRRFGDMTMYPLWTNASGSLSPLISVPARSVLAIDPRHVAFLQEDQKDAAEIMQRKIAAIGSAIINGFDPDSAVQAVAANDETKLVHTGLVSVQLQEPGTSIPPDGNTNGNGSGALPTLPSKAGANTERALNELLALAVRQEPPSVTFERGSIEAHFDAPPPADVHVDVNLPEQAPPVVNVDVASQEPVEPPVVNVTVPPQERQEPPVVNVTVEAPEQKPTRKNIKFADGRTATITTEETEDGV
jgi:hypothetical protein